jgi:histidinol-phosphate aminotransferase
VSPQAQPRPGIRATDPYVSPQLDVPTRLNTNECPHPLPEDFFVELAEAVRDLPLNRYPDAQMTRLREELATHHGHPFDGVWTANGSNEVLTQLLLAYGGPGRTALVFEPTYMLHARLARLSHTEVASLELADPYRLTEETMAEALAVRPDVLFVCSPNNPTGNAQPVELVAEIAAATDTLMIVDEAYVEFGGTSALKLTADHPNLAVVRTFSKAFAMAGARVGYVLTSPEVVGDLQRVRLPYHMSSLAQAAGIVALRHAAEALSLLDAIRAQRDRILTELETLDGVHVYPSDANFVLFVPPRPAAEVWQGLLDRGILVRDLSSVVPNALRVTAGAEHEVDHFLTGLREVLAA